MTRLTVTLVDGVPLTVAARTPRLARAALARALLALTR